MAFMAAIGPILSGVLGFAQASYQAKVANMNAEIAQDNAVRAIERSQVNEQTQSAQQAALEGEQQAVQSASGLDINSETSRRIRKTTAMLGRKDILNVRQDAELEKYNFLTDAANFKAQAGAAKIGGLGSLLGGFVQATGSLVGRSQSSGYSFTPKPSARPFSLVS